MHVKGALLALAVAGRAAVAARATLAALPATAHELTFTSTSTRLART